MDQIIIFKTNIGTQRHVQKIDTLFRAIKQIKKWSIDLEDCDRVLRVVSINLPYQAIEQLVKTTGVYCKKMDCFDISGQIS